MLTDSQLRRYARNISLEPVGKQGQEKLLGARVLVVGAGGLGAPVISYLAAAGVGHIGIVDYDRVELSNLQRQILFETGDIGRAKTEAAKDRVSELNPETRVRIYTEKLDGNNARARVKDYDIVADTSDNFATRFAVNAACHAEKKTLVSAAVRGFNGQLAVFKSYLGGAQPCYRCFVGGAPDDERGCSDVGVLGAFTGVVGSLQAVEVIKELLGIGESLAGQLLLLNALTLTQRKTRIVRDPKCEFCGRQG
jgi:adenylyltransferase/sulfurtransferase